MSVHPGEHDALNEPDDKGRPFCSVIIHEKGHIQTALENKEKISQAKYIFIVGYYPFRCWLLILSTWNDNCVSYWIEINPIAMTALLIRGAW